MILAIKNWCEGIVIAIIISIIVELLLPNGNNKKYVKVVSGIYIMFVILNPILEMLKYDINFENMFNFGETQQVTQTMSQDIKDIYVVGIKESIKQDIEKLGYNVETLEILLDSNYENIEKIELKVELKEDKVKAVEKVEIGKDKTDLDNSYSEIIELLKENYLVDETKIIFLSN
ncbi:MAG TPA: stage III sporulation protein AF [Candidatus Scatovivens faecipullorum]|nr:stage III sporulation protein AF [Candidatus Scatovivens faecipullorum]